MTSRDFWYGMSFHLTDAASALLDQAKEIEDDDEKDRCILRAAIMIDLNKAIRAGLDRELERQDLMQRNTTTDERKVSKR